MGGSVAEGGGKASKNEIPAVKKQFFEGSFAVCPAFFEVPVEVGTTIRQFQTTVPGIPEEFRRIP